MLDELVFVHLPQGRMLMKFIAVRLFIFNQTQKIFIFQE